MADPLEQLRRELERLGASLQVPEAADGTTSWIVEVTSADGSSVARVPATEMADLQDMFVRYVLVGRELSARLIPVREAVPLTEEERAAVSAHLESLGMPSLQFADDEELAG